MKKPTPTLFVQITGTSNDCIYTVVLKNDTLEKAKEKARQLWEICENPKTLRITDNKLEVVFKV